MLPESPKKKQLLRHITNKSLLNDTKNKKKPSISELFSNALVIDIENTRGKVEFLGCSLLEKFAYHTIKHPSGNDVLELFQNRCVIAFNEKYDIMTLLKTLGVLIVKRDQVYGGNAVVLAQFTCLFEEKEFKFYSFDAMHILGAGVSLKHASNVLKEMANSGIFDGYARREDIFKGMAKEEQSILKLQEERPKDWMNLPEVEDYNRRDVLLTCLLIKFRKELFNQLYAEVFKFKHINPFAPDSGDFLGLPGAATKGLSYAIIDTIANDFLELEETQFKARYPDVAYQENAKDFCKKTGPVIVGNGYFFVRKNKHLYCFYYQRIPTRLKKSYSGGRTSGTQGSRGHHDEKGYYIDLNSAYCFAQTEIRFNPYNRLHHETPLLEDLRNMRIIASITCDLHYAPPPFGVMARLKIGKLSNINRCILLDEKIPLRVHLAGAEFIKYMDLALKNNKTPPRIIFCTWQRADCGAVPKLMKGIYEKRLEHKNKDSSLQLAFKLLGNGSYGRQAMGNKTEKDGLFSNFDYAFEDFLKALKFRPKFAMAISNALSRHGIRRIRDLQTLDSQAKEEDSEDFTINKASVVLGHNQLFLRSPRTELRVVLTEDCLRPKGQEIVEGHFHYEHERDDQAANTSYLYAGEITAIVRNLQDDGARFVESQGGKCLYGDTDSLLITGLEESQLKPILNNRRLGSFKMEMHFSSFFLAAKKVYGLDITQAGTWKGKRPTFNEASHLVHFKGVRARPLFIPKEDPQNLKVLEQNLANLCQAFNQTNPAELKQGTGIASYNRDDLYDEGTKTLQIQGFWNIEAVPLKTLQALGALSHNEDSMRQVLPLTQAQFNQINEIKEVVPCEEK